MIPVYAINLLKRTDRKTHILNEFKLYKEFNLHIVKAHEHQIGALGLWSTLKHILLDLVPPNEEYIIICEDDHAFRRSYNLNKLLKGISDAKKLNADVLCGGVSWYTDALQISDSLFWVEKFSGLQFTVIFRKFFDKILQANFTTVDAADYKLSELSDKLFVLYPFISTQKEFGYSDVTPKNNLEGRVTEIFTNTNLRLRQLKKVSKYYGLHN